jgi:hypothetical protein
MKRQTAVLLASLALVLSLPVATAFAQVTPAAPNTDAFGGNAGAEFAEALPLEFPQEAIGNNPRARILRWNAIALSAVALDHTPPAPGQTRVFGEQAGPHRTSRALAIVHIAIFDTVNSATGNRYRSYTGLPAATPPIGLNVAIARAAHDTLASLYPAQRSRLGALLAEDLAEFPDGDEKSRGISLGRIAASEILSRRANDGAAHSEPVVGVGYFPGNGPGEWQPDPISDINVALGARWGQVRPFVMTAASQFRAPAPPALASSRYTAAYDEVKRLGGDNITTPTQRTTQQTIAGIYWAYDGTPNLGTPPRLYNQIAVLFANGLGTGNSDPVQLARLLALVNTAQAEAGLACWESKYFYKFWRPVTGIRRGNQDGNGSTIVDANYSPLGAPASNTNGGINFTPPFPAYPSGHATFGSALFQVLRRFYGTNNIQFTFVSDELNGVTTNNHGQVRSRIPLTFSTLSAAELHNAQSRIYLGIHWEFDKTAGITQGRLVGDYVFSNAFQPR